MPGLCVGLFLSFVLSAGSYVTPSILGGADDYMYGNLVYDAIMVELNWPLGSTLSIVLLIMFTLVSVLFAKYIGMSSVYRAFSR
jgi:spermidine/putrescine transport system permease protein